MDRKNDVITVEKLHAIKVALLELELKDPSELADSGAQMGMDLATFHAVWADVKTDIYKAIKREIRNQEGLSYDEARMLVKDVVYKMADRMELSDKITYYLDETADEVILPAIFDAKEVEPQKPKRKNRHELDSYAARVSSSYEVVPYLAGEMLELFLRKLPEGKFTEKFKVEVADYLKQGHSSIGAAKIEEITQRIIPKREVDSEDATQPSFIAIAMLKKAYKSMSGEKLSTRTESVIERLLRNETLQENFLTTRFINIPEKKVGTPKIFDLKVAFERACSFLSETLDEIAGGTLSFQKLMRYCEAEAVSPNFNEILKPREQRQLAELLKSYASVVFMQALEPEMTHDISRVVDKIEGELVRNSGPRR